MINPKLTEEFLLAQDDVLDASVWIDRGQLRAHVTLDPDSRTNTILLRGVCVAEIGVDQTPNEIVVIAPQQRNSG